MKAKPALSSCHQMNHSLYFYLCHCLSICLPLPCPALPSYPHFPSSTLKKTQDPKGERRKMYSSVTSEEKKSDGRSCLQTGHFCNLVSHQRCEITSSRLLSTWRVHTPCCSGSPACGSAAGPASGSAAARRRSCEIRLSLRSPGARVPSLGCWGCSVV